MVKMVIMQQRVKDEQKFLIVILSIIMPLYCREKR